MTTHTSRFPGSGTLIEESIIKGQALGQTQGQAEAILRILALREIDVPEAARERITSCTDLETLGTWLDRAVTATSVEELFAEVQSVAAGAAAVPAVHTDAVSRSAVSQSSPSRRGS